MPRVARVTASLAGATALAASTLVGATPAHATAAQCLDDLGTIIGLGRNVEPVALTPKKRAMTVAAMGGSRACIGANVSIGISRTNGTQFRNVNAVIGTPSAYWFLATFPMSWTDTGMWAVRQLAVGKSGKLVVRSWRPTASPSYADVRRGSVLTARLASTSAGTARVHGYLKAYSTRGTLTTLPAGQQVQIQARPRPAQGREYRTIGTATTSASGYWIGSARLTPGQLYDVRLAWPTRYSTIGSGYTWIAAVSVTR